MAGDDPPEGILVGARSSFTIRVTSRRYAARVLGGSPSSPRAAAATRLLSIPSTVSTRWASWLTGTREKVGEPAYATRVLLWMISSFTAGARSLKYTV